MSRIILNPDFAGQELRICLAILFVVLIASLGICIAKATRRSRVNHASVTRESRVKVREGHARMNGKFVPNFDDRLRDYPRGRCYQKPLVEPDMERMPYCRCAPLPYLDADEKIFFERELNFVKSKRGEEVFHEPTVFFPGGIDDKES